LSENDADDSRPTRVEEEFNGPKVPVPQKITEVRLAMRGSRACTRIAKMRQATCTRGERVSWRNAAASVRQRLQRHASKIATSR